ncbi:hypothetical protein Pmani_000628 [Petrolisthes manimaculis]|uniref:Uncharacterized protein n=1 Tax=Petrolisthes manimaculis TaxID=1843537 RepID=A0AAE1QPR2_9EUCA|nr:hypothetical protein Pmani_000628 [Petrolisthes manimaculis]
MDSNVLKTLLDSQEKAYRSAMEIVVTQLNTQIRKLENTVSDVTKSLELTQNEVDDLKQEISRLKAEKNKDNEVFKDLMDKNYHMLTK